jgi:hypothetical protein
MTKRGRARTEIYEAFRGHDLILKSVIKVTKSSNV